MEKQQIIDKIQGSIADAEVYPDGADCNFNVVVVSDQFENSRSIQRQQKVLGLFSDLLRSGELHALSVKAYTQSEWKAVKAESAQVQIQL